MTLVPVDWQRTHNSVEAHCHRCGTEVGGLRLDQAGRFVCSNTRLCELRAPRRKNRRRR